MLFRVFHNTSPIYHWFVCQIALLNHKISDSLLLVFQCVDSIFITSLFVLHKFIIIIGVHKVKHFFKIPKRKGRYFSLPVLSFHISPLPVTVYSVSIRSNCISHHSSGRIHIVPFVLYPFPAGSHFTRWF